MSEWKELEDHIEYNLEEETCFCGHKASSHAFSFPRIFSLSEPCRECDCQRWYSSNPALIIDLDETG